MLSNRPHIVLLGGSGQVGRALRHALEGQWPLTVLDRMSADLARPHAVVESVRGYRPDVIINAAAYTAVDRAEQQPELAYTVNATTPGILADMAHASGAAFIHYSSDYVFDGGKSGPYLETDAPAPLSLYGRSKLAGDVAVAAACSRHFILRTSWVYSTHGSNFLKTILRLGEERDELRIVADQVGAPTSARLIASVTASLLTRMFDAATDAAPWGLYNVAPTGEASWYSYACHVLTKAREMGWPIRLLPEAVHAISSSEYPVAAVRPANSRLDTRKLRKVLGIELPQWESDVDQTLHALHSMNQ